MSTSKSLSLHNAQKFDRLSGFAFLGALCSSILRLFILAPIFNSLTSFLYLAGYGFWFMANQFYPDQKSQHSQWYGFAKFKQQLSWAALVGLCATICSILAIFLSPPFAIVTCCLAVISNVLWMIGEFHKTQIPPDYDEYFSLSRQKSFTEYTTCMTGLSIISATLTIVDILLPTAYTPLLIFFAPIAMLTICYAVNRWIDYNFGNHQLLADSNARTKLPEDFNSYQRMRQTLDSNPTTPKHKDEIEILESPVERIQTSNNPPPEPFQDDNHDDSPYASLNNADSLSYN